MGDVKLLQFRLDFDTSYDSRWQSLNDAIRILAPNRWEQATASFIFHHPNTVEELRQYLVTNSTIHLDGKEMLMILDLSTHRVAQVGVKDPMWLNKVLATGNPFSHVA